MVDLREIMYPGEELTPLLSYAWNSMPDRFKKIITRTDPILTVTAKAKEIMAEEKNFARSDIGQVIGIKPDIEVYYTPSIGKPGLRDLIAEFWSRFYKLDNITGANVAITIGATQALGLLFSIYGYRKTDTSGKVILMKPYWPTFPDVITKAGAEYAAVEIFDENRKLKLTEIRNVIKTEDIHTVLINLPNNPSGMAVSKETMIKLAEFARENDLILISDEVYNRVIFTGEPQTMLSFAPERTVVVSAASKEYLMPGHRIGYIISTSPTLTDVFLKKLVRCAISCPGTVGQDIFIEMLKKEVEELRRGKSPSFLEPVIEQLRERRDALADVLQKAGFKLLGDRPSDGTIFMLAKIPEGIEISDVEFIDRALEMKKISGIPASACGKPGWIRFSFGSMRMEDIERFGRNIKEVVKSLKMTKPLPRTEMVRGR